MKVIKLSNNIYANENEIIKNNIIDLAKGGTVHCITLLNGDIFYIKTENYIGEVIDETK